MTTPSGGVTNFPPTTEQNQICWVGVPNQASNLVMFMNSDLNNYAYIGYSPNLVIGVNTIPIAPNGNINLPANRTVYAIWSTAVGVQPLVVIPGGAAYFLGITQGLGNLAIPSVQSPNFVSNVSGWQIDKNGNAQFNNLTLRGTFFGLDFIINSSGAFFYNGTPALGNLKISIASSAGVYQFGNVYTDNVASYNTAVAGGGYAQLAANDVTGIPYLVLLPASVTNNLAPPQANGGAVNAGTASEQVQINVVSGYENTPGSAGAATLQLVSRPNNGGVGTSFAQLIGDNTRAVRPDGTSYPVGQKIFPGVGLPLTINSTSAQGVTATASTTPGLYKIEIELIFTGSAAGAGNPSFQIGTTGTVTSWGNGIIWQTTGAGAGANRVVASTSGMLFQGPGMVAAALYTVKLKCYATFTTNGAVSLQAFTSLAADSYVINQAIMEVTPNF